MVGEIKRHFRDKGWAIRVPRALQELNASMSGAIERLTGRLGALAEHRRDRRGAQDHAGGGARGDGGRAPPTRPCRSRPGPSGEDELDPLETIGDEDAGFERSEDRAALEPALERLAPREREILRMRFEEGLPQTQIAQRVGLRRCTSRA